MAGDRDKSAGPRREPYASPQHQGFWETIDDSTMIALDITRRKEKGEREGRRGGGEKKLGLFTIYSNLLSICTFMSLERER